jgi:phage host-nuclease inhibitor protein Gam
MSRTFSSEERTKLKQLITEAIGVTTEVETLQGGLNDTIAAIAEEMQLKPNLLKKAVKMAMKRDYDKAREDLDIIESILQSTDNLKDSV